MRHGTRPTRTSPVVRRVTSLTAAVGTVAATCLVTVVATGTAAHADAAPGAVELTVPAGVRSEPRVVHLQAETSQGVVLDREVDVTYARAGYTQHVLAHADGSTSPVAPDTVVLGDSIVDKSGSTLTRTYLENGQVGSTVDTVTLAPNHFALGYVDRGVLVADVADQWNPVLSLDPWDGGTAVPVTGYPAGHRIETGNVGHDAAGQVLRAAAAGGPSRYFYVGFATATVTAMPVGTSTGTSDGTVCTSAAPGSLGVGEGHVAWLPATESGADPASVVCDWAVPSAGAPQGGPVNSRDVTGTGALANPSMRQVLPVGDDIVVWSGSGPQNAAAQLPVYAVSPSGVARTLVGWGHDVVASTPGHVLVVGGPTASDEQVRRIDVAAGTGTVASVVDPVASTVDTVAVDDTQVAASDDSTPRFSVTTRTVQAPSTNVGAPTVVDGETDPAFGASHGGNMVAGEGSLAWSGPGQYSQRWALRDPQGVVHRGSGAYGQISAVSAPWLLIDGAKLIDTRTSAVTPVSNAGADLFDGVLYLPGASAGASRKDVVVARDLETRRTDLIPVTGCTSVYRVQVAGSWMLVGCNTTTTSIQVLLDRTGALPDRVLTFGGQFGNGFLARRLPDGDVQWRPLADLSVDWATVGTGATDTVDEVDYYTRLAVGREHDPLVAWAGQHNVGLVRLPVETSPMPAHPTGTAAPAPPVVTTAVGNTYVTLTWATPAAEDHVTGYDVREVNNRWIETLGPEARTATFYNLTNGSSYGFRVTALSDVGKTPATVSATPLAPPAFPFNLGLNVAKDRSTATVSWTWNAGANSEPLQDFTVLVGDQTVAAHVPADQRTVTFPLTDSTSGQVFVSANGPRQNVVTVYGPTIPAPTPPAPEPAPDSTAPTASLAALAPVLLASSTTVTTTAADDRQLDPTGPVEVRWRSAGTGAALGAWTTPASWQRLSPGRLSVTGLAKGRTYCFSTRARDAAGNTSAWTPDACTTTALDQTSLTKSAGWTTGRSSHYYGGSAASSTRTSSTLRRTMRANAAWVVASTCPTCGKVGVYVGSTRLTTLNLKSTKRVDRHVFSVPLGTRRTGTLTLRPATSGRPTIIDGVAMRSY